MVLGVAIFVLANALLPQMVAEILAALLP